MTIDDNTPSNGDFDDDDSFSLENLESYPGDLSTFMDVTPSATDADKTAVPDDASPKPMNSDTPMNEDSSFDTNERAFETESDTAFTSEISTEVSEDVSPEEEIDTDDFVRQLQADLERSKAKKAAQASQISSPPEAEPVKKVEFTSVDDLSGTEEIDLSTITAHHPSTYRQMEEAAEEAAHAAPANEEIPEESDSGYSGYAQMAASMSTEPPAEAPKPEPAATPKKEKKNRKPLYMTLAACVALLAIGFGGYSLYPLISQMFGSHSPAEAGHADSTKKHTPTVAHDAHEEHHEAADSVVAETHGDTAHHQEEAHAEAKPASHEGTHAPEEPAHATKAPAHVAAKHEETNHDEPKHETSKETHTPEPKKIAVPKPAPKPVVVKEVKTPTIARATKLPTTTEAKPQVFTVQVYSSPSKDDADERLTRLKSRNATNASLSEQTIRGQKWYRVRFGAFTSRDEAEAAARQLGFTQCWIDRVR